jgi:hypothetical protein
MMRRHRMPWAQQNQMGWRGCLFWLTHDAFRRKLAGASEWLDRFSALVFLSLLGLDDRKRRISGHQSSYSCNFKKKIIIQLYTIAHYIRVHSQDRILVLFFLFGKVNQLPIIQYNTMVWYDVLLYQTIPRYLLLCTSKRGKLYENYMKDVLTCIVHCAFIVLHH